MAKIVGLPKLSPTMEEGTLVEWVKKEGEAVEVGGSIHQWKWRYPMTVTSFIARIVEKKVTIVIS